MHLLNESCSPWIFSTSDVRHHLTQSLLRSSPNENAPFECASWASPLESPHKNDLLETSAFRKKRNPYGNTFVKVARLLYIYMYILFFSLTPMKYTIYRILFPTESTPFIALAPLNMYLASLRSFLDTDIDSEESKWIVSIGKSRECIIHFILFIDKFFFEWLNACNLCLNQSWLQYPNVF